jgi:hypothetical protein
LAKPSRSHWTKKETSNGTFQRRASDMSLPTPPPIELLGVEDAKIYIIRDPPFEIYRILRRDD